MMAPKLRFSCGLKAKAAGAVTCTALVPAPTSRSSKFLQAQRTGPAPIDWTQEATMVKVRIFFFFTFEGLLSVGLLFYQRFDAALLLWSSPDSWLAMFHSRRCSYIRTDDPSTKTGVHCELEHRGLRSLRAVWSIFPHQALAIGAPVTSFLCQPISTAIPVALAFNKTKPALSSIAVVSKAFKRTARASLCRIWEHPQRCFPPFGQKPRKA